MTDYSGTRNALEAARSVNVEYTDPRGSIGELGQTDFDFINDETVAGDGEVVASLRAPGGDEITGQAQSTGQFSIRVRWLDETFTSVRDEGIISNREGGAWANYALDPKSPFVDIVVVEESGNQQTVDITAHYR